MDSYKKAMIELDHEMNRQVDMILPAAAIALRREWKWSSAKIKGILEETHKVWKECASSNQISMLEMLENETGIEMRAPGVNKSWHDLPYLNAKLDSKLITKEQWTYMRQQQKKWMGCLVEASVFLALHRKYGFGFERISRLRNQIEDIRFQYDLSPKKLLEACAKETKVRLVEGIAQEVA